MITLFLLLSVGCIILAEIIDNSNCKLYTIFAIPRIIGIAGCAIFGIWTMRPLRPIASMSKSPTRRCRTVPLRLLQLPILSLLVVSSLKHKWKFGRTIPMS